MGLVADFIDKCVILYVLAYKAVFCYPQDKKTAALFKDIQMF